MCKILFGADGSSALFVLLKYKVEIKTTKRKGSHMKKYWRENYVRNSKRNVGKP